ncbi:MAG: class I ribonucleotide reductase maintenance protein YfaE [Oleibacter sp.]|nr:class I ribonucleotide reductase maintenance protein YfaE [Thalassolituus sp.]
MPSIGKTPRLGRRRWSKSQTFYSVAQTEMELVGASSTQFELDLDTPASPTSRRNYSRIELEDIEQGDLFGYMAESPEPTPQIVFDGMEKPSFGIIMQDGRTASFQHATTLLESLESQDIHLEFQCREGYCGSCRVRLLDGEVHYFEEPMAWIDDDEILPCCCVPKTPLKLQLS